MPDINRQNNNLKIKGLFKKTEPVNLKMMGLVHNTDKTQLFWMPVMGWNYYNKFMFGAAMYNNFLPEKKLEWVFMPMYGFGNKDLAGGASIHYNIHLNKIFQSIRFGANVERYCYANDPLDYMNFNKIAPDLTFEVKKKHLTSQLKQTFNIRQINVWKEFANIYYPPGSKDTNYTVNSDFTYLIDNRRKIN